MELLRRKKDAIKPKNPKEKKCVLVGGNRVGKTSLMITHETGSFPHGHPLGYIPIVCDNFLSMYIVDSDKVVLSFFDTPTREDFIRLYPGTDVFLICFSMVDIKSYEDVYTKWFPELTFHSPNVPIILVGTQRDRCGDPQTINRLKKQQPCSVPLTSFDGVEMAERIGAKKFVECSAFLQKGVADVFREAALAANQF